MIQNFLAQTILNGPIRKVIMVKVKFEDLQIFFTTRSTRLDTWKIFQKFFFSKIFFAQKVSKWSNSKSYHGKSEIWRPTIFFTDKLTKLSKFDLLSEFVLLNLLNKLNKLNKSDPLNKLNKSHQLYKFNKFNKLNKFNKFKKLNMLKKVNKLNNMNKWNRMNKMNKMKKMKKMKKMLKLRPSALARYSSSTSVEGYRSQNVS